MLDLELIKKELDEALDSLGSNSQLEAVVFLQETSPALIAEIERLRKELEIEKFQFRYAVMPPGDVSGDTANYWPAAGDVTP